MKIAGREVNPDSPPNDTEPVTPSGLQRDTDGHLVIDMEAAARVAYLQLQQMRSVVRLNNVEVHDVLSVRRIALDYATRGAGGSMTEEVAIARAQAFERYLVIGSAEDLTQIGSVGL